MDAVCEKYLARYSHPLTRGDLPLVSRPFRTAVVVPAFKESPRDLERLIHHHVTSRDDLLILVVNQPRGAPVSAAEENRRFISAVRHTFADGERSATGPLELYRRPNGLSALLVDLTSEDLHLPPKEAVGTARKMGTDIALRLYQERKLMSVYVGSSDCDARLPPEYFDRIAQHAEETIPGKLPRASALLFPYRHDLDDTNSGRRMAEVEATFRYYVLGLARSRSPYAYHSLGSALSVSLLHYARVRGFPQRAAGEDFYLLDKLVRIAPLRRVVSTPVALRTRVSDRVPFGTGPSLDRALRSDVDHSAVTTYAPEAFALLGRFLEVLVRGTIDMTSPLQGIPASDSSSWPPWMSTLATEIWTDLRPTLPACPTANHRVRRFHERFDALTTLQFIHQAHREGLTRLSVSDAVVRAGLVPSVRSPFEMVEDLRRLEGALPEWVGPTAEAPPEIA